MQANRVGVLLAATVAMLAFSSLVATASQAVGGPEWRIACHKVVVAKTGSFKNSTCTEAEANGEFSTKLLAGETRATKSVNVSATFKLNGAVKIECKKVTNTGLLIGGNPGTDSTKIIFTECSIAGKTVAECGAKGLKPIAATNAGEVIVGALTVLAYPNEKAGSEEASLDAFAPEGEAANPNLYVEFELTGTNCALLKNQKIRVNAIGTEIEINGKKRKCGVLAQVGEISGTSFRSTKSGESGVEGALNFPEPFIEKAELWEPIPAAFKAITCKLEADSAAAEEVGLAKVETNPAEKFGWAI